MKLFTTYSASQLDIFTPVYKKGVETQVYSLPRHISDTSFLQIEETIVIPLVSAVEKGIRRELVHNL